MSEHKTEKNNTEQPAEVQTVAKVTGQKPGETMVYFNNTAGGTDHGSASGAPIPLRDFIKAMQFKDEHRGLIVRVRNK